MLSIFSTTAYSQEIDFWQVLSDVKFESIKKDDQEMDLPKFGMRAQGFDGKKIRLKGYLVPLSDFGGTDGFMLSSLPLNACFFCGGAGPETVVEIQVKQSVKFTSALVILEGILVLNSDDPDHHIYILKEVSRID